MKILRTLTGATTVALFALPALAQEPHFGGDADTAYAALLWDVMVAQHLVGENSLRSLPYEGIEPHGFMLETFYSRATIDGHDGTLVVKRNYGPAGVEVDQVVANPEDHLAALTIMFRREDGYDPDNGNWYWVKYLPDGSLDVNPAGVQLAGRIGKNAEAGCIACHLGAGGDDYLFTTDAALD